MVVLHLDVDRLALICEDGTMFGEEYTLVAVSNWTCRTNWINNGLHPLDEINSFL